MWSLENELMTLTMTPTFAGALSSVGLLPTSEVNFSHQIIKDWHRSGAETYTLIFEVTSGQSWRQKAVLKACVAYSTANTLQEILGKWITRRQLLKELGVATPTLFSWGYGLILERYIEHALGDVFPALTSIPKENFVAQLIHLAACLDHHRFLPTALFDELRTDGHRVYLVDFGSNLGESDMQIPEYSSLRNLHQFLGLPNVGSITNSSLYPLYCEAIARLSLNTTKTKMS